MDINTVSIGQLVEYVNQELSKGRTMVDIETNDFNVNERVIAKRLTRRGYKRVENEFKQGITNVIQKDNTFSVIQKQAVSKVIEPNKNNIIQKYNKDITEDKLIEIVALIEPIKEMLEEFKRNKNIIDVNTVELRPKAIKDVKQKLFKVDTNVLEQWEEFILKHKEFKVQQLISLALEEFIQKYN
ncbi:MAG: hypothetical protein ACRC7N_01950 [Clostridium sp.]